MSSLLDKTLDSDGEVLDSALRPKNWQDYVGQEKIKENIKKMCIKCKSNK